MTKNRRIEVKPPKSAPSTMSGILISGAVVTMIAVTVSRVVTVLQCSVIG